MIKCDVQTVIGIFGESSSTTEKGQNHYEM